MRVLMAVLVQLCIALPCIAADYVAGDVDFSLAPGTGADVTLLFASSPIYNGGSHPTCGDRLYVLNTDKQLFVSLLTRSVTNQRVHIYYSDSAPYKTVPGHGGTTCQVISVWWDA